MMLQKIIGSLRNAAKADNFHDGAYQLLKTLGYESNRRGLETFTAEEFVDFQNKHSNRPENAPPTQSEIRFLEDVESVRILFQMGDDDVEFAAENSEYPSPNPRLFDPLEKSVFFAAVELKRDIYKRGEYADFTRQIDKRLPIATVALFRTNSKPRRVSIALADRRERINDPLGRPVLGRVSLLREIDPEYMRSDAEILEDLALSNRLEWMKAEGKPNNFDGLLDAWLNALDIESLNNDFYDRLEKWFGRVVKTATFPQAQPPQEHAVRLITRMLFIWFMKEKGLVNKNLFNPKQVAPLLRNWNIVSGDSYYRAVLQNLFFATLNTPIDRRDFSRRDNSTHRVPNLYRYADLIRDPEALRKLFNETPFINGGLFECLDDLEGVNAKGKRVDCFTDNTHQRKELSVPNSLFFDDDKNNIGLFPLFKGYKFTVEENTPIEQEVALDPELLGKVFENLLAEMNPETRDTALKIRKETGSYYTPRAVVNYMTKEALAAELAQKVQPDHENAGDYWSENMDVLLDDEKAWDEAGKLFSPAEKRRLAEGIADLKILDPAVGSGAFPMAALLKLTMALRRLEPDSVESDYDRKLRLIQNNIFGVDILRIACQIAKLRFFITLAIEQESSDDPNKNYGFKPLPNLETRFVAADALLPLHPPGSDRPLRSERTDELEQEIHENRQEYFPVNERRKKRRLKRENERLRKELSEQLKGLKWTVEAAERIVNWDVSSQTDEPADWFDPEYMFGVRYGFDVVIGNPPYVQLQNDDGYLGKKYQDAGYISFTKMGDIYCLFYEQALNLAADGGCACFITSNKWMRSDYGKKLRDLFVEKTSPLLLVNMGPGVFEASVDTNILLLSNASPLPNAVMKSVEVKPDFNRQQGGVGEYVRKNSIEIPVPSLGRPWTIASAAEMGVLKKMRRVGTPLKDWEIAINWGIKTGYNKAFIIDADTRNRLEFEDPRSKEILKPTLRGRDIDRWRARGDEIYLITTFPAASIDIDSYPSIKNYLLSFGRDRLEQCGKKLDDGRKSRKKTKHAWFELQDVIAYHKKFSKEKLVWSDIKDQANFAYDDSGVFCDGTGFIMTGESLKYLCAVLNSRLAYWYLHHTAPVLGAKAVRWKKTYIEPIPIPSVAPSEEAPLVLLVDAILSKKASDPEADVSQLEAKIDERVYALYGLTEEERAVVSGG